MYKIVMLNVWNYRAYNSLFCISVEFFLLSICSVVGDNEI